MPIYEFKCNECGKTFEQLVFSSDQGKDILCPSCGAKDTCRLMSAFSCSSSSEGGLGASHSSSCSGQSRGFS
ncbi:MAG: zinc ribbon domain-containing protein [Deltaproteobacteria bacterium]|nr:zinc ribbon domain-containing protein [Deltaproteobacteria bacterium]